MRTDLLFCDGKLQLKHAPGAKINKIKSKKKNIKNVTKYRDSRSAKSRETR